MSEILAITEKIRIFNAERDWSQFHNAKDLAIALNIESSELLELFLWKDPEEVPAARIMTELADVFAYAFMLADKYGFDVGQIVNEKIHANTLKYPIDKAKGVSTKYNEL